MIKDKIILVTGAAGLLGSNLVQYILEKTNHIIIALDNYKGGFEEYIPIVEGRILKVKLDLSNQYEVEELFKKYYIDYIFHLAAFAAEGLSPFMRCHNYQENTVNSAFLINMAIKYNIKKFIFTSSMAVYGNLEPPFHEDMIPQPVDPYGIAKYATELDLKVAKEQHGLDYCIIRPHNVYGPNQNIWDPYRGVLGIWIRQIKENKPITIYGDGEQVRSFSYIGDFTPALWNALVNSETSGEIINLGSSEYHTLNQAAQILKEAVSKLGFRNVQIEYLEKRHEVKKAYSTYQKSIELLDYQEKYDLKNGLEVMAAWAFFEPNREVKKWDHYELENGIYSYWRH